MAKVEVIEQKAHAVLTFKGASGWTPQGRKLIADWLHDQAQALLKDGANYAPRFRARYLSRDY